MTWDAVVPLLCVLCLLLGASAIQERDVGKQDLYYQNIGIVQRAHFHMSPQRKRVLVSTSEGTVASLNLKNSNVAWRHVLSDSGLPALIDSTQQGNLLALTGNGYLHYFDGDGSLLWDVLLQPASAWQDALILNPDGNADEQQNIAVLFNNSVQLRSGRDGNIIASYSPSLANFVLFKLHAHESKLYVVGGSPATKTSRSISVLVFDLSSTGAFEPKTVTLSKECDIAVPNPLDENPFPFILVEQYLVGVSASGTQFFINTLGQQQKELVSINQAVLPKGSSLPSGMNYISLRSLGQTSSNGKTTAAFVLAGGSTVASLKRDWNGILLSFVAKAGEAEIQFRQWIREDGAVSFASQQDEKQSDHLLVALFENTSESTSTLKILDVGSGNTVVRSELPAWSNYSKNWLVDKAWIKTSRSKGSSTSDDGESSGSNLLYNVLVSGKDGLLILTSLVAAGPEDGKQETTQSKLSIRWRREEALSQVVQAEFVELPVERSTLQELSALFSSGTGGSVGGGLAISRFFAHIKSGLNFLLAELPTHSLQFARYLSNVASDPSSILNSNSDSLEVLMHKPQVHSKLILLRTKVGKLFAIDNKSGRIIWDKYYPPHASDAVAHLYRKNNLGYAIHHMVFSNKKNSHVKDSMSSLSPTVTLVFQYYDKSGNEETKHSWIIDSFDALTGKPLRKSTTLKFNVKHLVLPPANLVSNSDESGVRWLENILLLIDDDDQIHIYPNTAEAKQALHKNNENQIVDTNYKYNDHNLVTYYYTITTDASGQVISSRRIFRLNNEGDLSSVLVWKKTFPFTSTERIIATSGGNQELVLNTYLPATPLPDGNVLWKYLNPNILVIGTETIAKPTKFTGAPSLRAEDYALTIYILDIVTGRIIYRVEHPNAAAPLHIVNAENWVVYHYWNAKTHTYEMSTIQLYQTRKDWTGSLFSSFDPDTNPLFESQNNDNRLIVEQQSWIFPGKVSALAVTTTKHGLTNKQVLAASTDTQQVIALDKRFLEPRRPMRAAGATAPTPEEQYYMQEGVLPYTPVLGLSPLRVINYNHTLEGVIKIAVGSTDLESTTEVLCYGGVDLFYARALALTKVYDRLEDSFNRNLIHVSLLALVIASLLTSVLAKRAALRARWK